MAREPQRSGRPDPTQPLPFRWKESVPARCSRTAIARGDHPAIVDAQGSWTYARLEERSNQLAHWLRSRGVRRGDLVAIWAERAASLVWALLGTWKAGGAFVVLDPASPASRILDRLGNAGPRAFLQIESTSVPEPVGRFVSSRVIPRLQLPLSSDSAGPLQDFPTEAPDVAVGPGDLAYVGFTSGSTGKPRGVLGTHAPISHFLEWHCGEFGFTEADRFSLLSGLSHDPLLRDVFTPLWLGATLCVPRREDLDPGRLTRWMGDTAITVAHLTPALGRLATEGKESVTLPNLRHAFFGGDSLMYEEVRRFRELAPSAVCVNFYGATETPQAIASFALPEPVARDAKLVASSDGKIVAASDGRIVPLGHGIEGVQMLVLRSDGKLAGPDESGEIYVRTPYLSLGYLDDEAATAERFLKNPFTGIAGDRLYRTGDLGRYLPDGTVAFEGRRDRQVKLRGFRIELEEIETELTSHPEVRRAAVVLSEHRPEEKRLIAYVEATRAGPELARTLRRDLKRRLPDPMIPAAFVPLERLPTTPNGKIDFAALPPPPRDRSASRPIGPARTVTEKVLVQIWSEVLDIDSVGVEDDFFELGGDSLTAARVLSRTNASLGVPVGLREFFEGPTITSFARRLDAMRAGARVPSISAVSCDEHPLSFGQEALWFLDQLNPGTALFNIPKAYRIRGDLDTEALQRALAAIVARHRALSTVFVEEEGRPAALDAGDRDFELPLEDLANASEPDFARRVTEEADRPFDLSRDPMMRARLFRRTPREHLLVVTFHHIASDGWSIGVFQRELSALYGAYASGKPAPLPELPIQYSDFARWQREKRNRSHERDLDYWRKQLDGLRELALLTDRPRAAARSYKAERHPLILSKGLTRALRELGRREGATLFMTLLAAFLTLLHRYTASEDIAVSTPVAGRNREETEPLIGFFINTLVLRQTLTGETSFRELLRRVAGTCLEAFDHQDLAFGRLVQELGTRERPGRATLAQVMFVLQNSPRPPLELAGLDIAREDAYSAQTTLDLTLEAWQTGDGLELWFEYRTDLFDALTIARMAGHFHNLLEGIVAAPETRLAQVSLLGADERTRLLVEWNRTEGPYPKDVCIHQLIEDQARRTPEATAAEMEGKTLTYCQLDRLANAMAARLRARGVGPEVLVGLLAERSLEALVGLLGVLKAGGAYLPLDPALPRDRLEFLIADAGAALVLTQRDLAVAAPQSPQRILLDEALEGEGLEETPATGARPSSLAYVIYTSGSTGQPKGVEVLHESLVNFACASAENFGLGAGDRVLQFASWSFDAAAEEIFPALCRGATLVLRTRGMLESISCFLQKVREWTVTMIDLPTSFWHELASTLNEKRWRLPQTVRLVVIGGERARPEKLAQWREAAGGAARLVNTYGPTEATVVTTACDLTGDNDPADPSVREVPIGRPIRNVRVYVLDRLLQPVPSGVAGELWIAGAGLARGYRNRPDLTAARFPVAPFPEEPGRIYRSGDTARYRDDGNLEYLGRADDQVKLRGFRVEPGEIECALAEHPQVRDVAVLGRQTRSGEVALVAYVVLSGEPPPRARDLRRFLRQRLPEHMVPSVFIELPQLPRMWTGKLDREALPGLEVAVASAREDSVAPRTRVECKLAEIWRKVLNLETVGISDDFFELGGHSLLAMQLMSRVREAFDFNLPLATLFDVPTIERLAAKLSSEEWEAPWSPLVVIQGRGSRPPFFCVPGIGGNVLGFHDLARQLAPDQPVYGLQAIGLDGKRPPLTRIEEMAANYVREIKSVLPEGPFLLGGASFGGVVAYEMARQLESEGRKVALLALFDASAPGPPAPSPWLALTLRRGRSLADRLAYNARSLWNDPLQTVRAKSRTVFRKVRSRIWRILYASRRESSRPLPRLLRDVEEAGYLAYRRYVGGPYGGKVTAFRAEVRSVGESGGEDMGWGRLALGGVELHSARGDHLNMLERPQADSLAEQLRACIENAIGPEAPAAETARAKVHASISA